VAKAAALAARAAQLAAAAFKAAAMTFFTRRGYRDDWIATHRIALESARRLGDRVGEARGPVF
jgi:hypothetical protein